MLLYKNMEADATTTPNILRTNNPVLYFYYPKHGGVNSAPKRKWCWGASDSEEFIFDLEKKWKIKFCVETKEYLQKFPCPKKFPFGY